MKRKCLPDAEFIQLYRNKKGELKHRRIACCTEDTSNFLGIIHEMYPNATISELRENLTDRTKWLPNPDAIAVLDACIAKGAGSRIPKWEYNAW